MAGPKILDRNGPVVLALGPGKEGAGLLAQGNAIALSSDRGLACVTVDDGGILSPEAQARLLEYHELARAEGASVARVPGVYKAQALAEYAEELNAPTVVVGCGPGGLAKRGVASALMGSRRGFAVVAVSPPRPARPRRSGWSAPRMGGSPGQFLAALLSVAAVTALGLALASYAGYWTAAILYLAAISVEALWLEPGPVLFAALASALAWDVLFIPPRFALTISRPEDAFMLALYLVVSLSAGLTTSRLRASERLLRAEHERVARVNGLAISLAGAPSSRAILDRGLASLKDAIDCEAIAIFKGENGSLKTEPEGGWEALDARTRAAADAAFREGAPTGRFTRVEGASEWHFAPLGPGKGRLGVIGVRAPSDADWDESAEACLNAYASMIAVALSREG